MSDTITNQIYEMERDKETGTVKVRYCTDLGTYQGSDKIGNNAFHVRAYLITHSEPFPNVTQRIYRVPNWNG